MYPPQPNWFLDVRVQDLEITPGLVGLCAGYESNEWRCKQLASHICEWLPEFALAYTELEGLSPANMVQLVVRAASVVYKTVNPENRGEIGELLLHIGIRQVFETIPAISKLHFKDSPNDTVKGFDAVHVLAADDGLELWLGEAKFYKDIGSAIRDVVDELQKHTKRDYLRTEFAAITNKVDNNWPHAEGLKKLLDKHTSLDEVFRRLTIPVLLTYESPTISEHRCISATFLKAFEEEVMIHYTTFVGRTLPDIRMQVCLLPMESRQELVEAFDERLKAWQV